MEYFKSSYRRVNNHGCTYWFFTVLIVVAAIVIELAIYAALFVGALYLIKAVFNL